MNTVDYINNQEFLLLVVFEKVFDTVKWFFLYEELHKFNFGNVFVNWKKIIYTEIYSKVTNNGYLSDSIPISRGIRQGDPISALIFLPVAEIISILIRGSANIRGININDCEIKLCQFADDTTPFLRDNLSILIALQSFEEFYRYAGLKINLNKTEAIQLWQDKNKK